jgi:hypothetical protein
MSFSSNLRFLQCMSLQLAHHLDALAALKVGYGVGPSGGNCLDECPDSAQLARCSAFRRSSPF